MMFDSSAKHQGIALNDVLLEGPDTSNSLQVILKRTQKALMKGGGSPHTLQDSFELKDGATDV